MHRFLSVNDINFVEPTKPSGREVYILLDSGRDRRAGVGVGVSRRTHGSNLARHETASELNKTVKPQPL